MKPGETPDRARREIRMMISSAGRRVGLLNSFRDAAAHLGISLEILACDQNVELSSACHEADRRFAVPPANDPTYADVLHDICRSHNVALLVPTIDPELQPLADARDRFAETGTCVAVSGPELISMARDKLETARFLAAHGIASPRTATPDGVITDAGSWNWPLLAKPRHGSSGRLVQQVASVDDVKHLPADEPFIVQELLKGREHTINMYFDLKGKLHCAVPHERLQIRSGEVEKGVTCRHPALEEIARRIGEALPGPRGALCFQAMVDDNGSASVFEINARFGGGYPLADRSGAHFARWLLEETAGLPPSMHNDWQEGMLMLRYDAALFVAP